MRVLGLCLVFALAAADTVNDWPKEVAAATRSKQVMTMKAQGENDGDNDSCDSLYSCQDCRTSRICRPSADGVLVQLQTISCPKERPFCEPKSGSCVSEEPDTCGEKDDTFVCMDNGKFPDTECTKFHACLDLQSVTFECSVEGEKYNPLTKTCEASTACGTFDCATMQGYKVPHSEHPGFYAYCAQNNGPLVIDSCPGNYELNVTSQICEPSCHAEGIVADVTDCHSYFKCSKVYVRRDLTYMQKDRLKCPEGQGYSTKDFLCVEEANVASCKSP